MLAGLIGKVRPRRAISLNLWRASHFSKNEMGFAYVSPLLVSLYSFQSPFSMFEKNYQRMSIKFQFSIVVVFGYFLLPSIINVSVPLIVSHTGLRFGRYMVGRKLD